MSGGGGGAVRAVRSQGGGAVVRWRKRACECGRMRGWSTRLSPTRHCDWPSTPGGGGGVARRRSAQPGVRWAVGLAWVQLTRLGVGRLPELSQMSNFVRWFEAAGYFGRAAATGLLQCWQTGKICAKWGETLLSFGRCLPSASLK